VAIKKSKKIKSITPKKAKAGIKKTKVSKVAVKSKAKNTIIAKKKTVVVGKKVISSKKTKGTQRPEKKAKMSKAAMAREAKRVAEEALKIKQQEEQKKMQRVVKILGDASIRQTLIEIGGENALSMVRSFYGNNSDEELAKKLKIKISDVRATLNKLHNEGLVNYIREKDSETGWYSYSWSLNHERIEKWANIQTSRVNLEGDSEYYFCPSCGAASIINFESAATVEFRCERCNRLLEFIDEKKLNELYEK
jgi:transcription initiation factor TFIIE subunit alpha